jgi:MtN3 and saliva related transmembrane protein
VSHGFYCLKQKKIRKIRMYSHWTGVFGGVGGIGTTFSFVPQVWKVFRSTSKEALSPYMLVIHSVGVSSWIVYGILKDDYYVITFNFLSLFMVQSMLFKIAWDNICGTGGTMDPGDAGDPGEPGDIS